MRNVEEAIEQLTYHPATPETAPKHAAVREIAISTAVELFEIVPAGPERTLALRKLQECAMYANLAIALTAPVDHDHAHVARVLPDAAQD